MKIDELDIASAMQKTIESSLASFQLDKEYQGNGRLGVKFCITSMLLLDKVNPEFSICNIFGKIFSLVKSCLLLI